MERYYLAYGSNLSVAQMAQRCPDAVYVGTAEVEGYGLLFKGSLTGSYLTVEKKEGGRVPVLVWRISEADERNLDRYEGCPAFYYKTKMRVKVKTFIGGEKEADALIYIMHEDRSTGRPSMHYYDVCHEGYCRFGFDTAVLEQALTDSVGKRAGQRMLKEAGYYG